MTEKFDFSKIENQQKFENLLQKEKDKKGLEFDLEKQNEEIEKKLSQEDERVLLKRTLEIGVGAEPFFASKKPLRKLENNEMYIGLDVDEEILKIAKSKSEQKDINFIRGSGENVPLKDASVDEVVMREILDAPASYFKYRMRLLDKELFIKMVNNFHSWDFEDPETFNDFPEAREYIRERIVEPARKYKDLEKDEQTIIDSYYGFLEGARVEQEAKINFINEAKRVMKREGKLILINTSTTEISRPFIKYLETDPFFERLSLNDDEMKKWQGVKGVDAFKESKEIKEFEIQLKQFFENKELEITTDVVNFTLNIGKEEEIPSYFFRITNRMMVEKTKSPEGKDVSISASKSLLHAGFYLWHRFMKTLKAESQGFSGSDYKTYTPILFIIDREKLLKDKNIEIKNGIEKNEIEIKGDFTPHALCVNSADKFMIMLQFLGDLLPREEKMKLKYFFKSYLKEWQEIEILRNRRVPKEDDKLFY